MLLPDIDTTDDILTIDQLQDKLTSNSYYFNNVKLSNIILEVITFVAMKEGRKILKRANDMMNRCSDHYNPINREEIRLINASLTQFTLIYNDLTKVIDPIIALNESTEDLKETFETQLNETVSLFNNSTTMEHSEFKFILCSTDTKISMLDNVIRMDHNFDSFYLGYPLINMKTLLDHTSELIYLTDEKIQML